MARYIQCSSCFYLNDPVVNSCAKCGGSVGRSEESQVAIHMFPAGNWEHIAVDPIRIRNRQELKDACAEHGCRANILD